MVPYGLGKSMVIRVYFDANHTGNILNRRSHTGIIIYVNNARIVWFRKQQNTANTSYFGSDLIALSVSTEMVDALSYKLRTFDIPINVPAEVFCNNQ